VGQDGPQELVEAHAEVEDEVAEDPDVDGTRMVVEVVAITDLCLQLGELVLGDGAKRLQLSRTPLHVDVEAQARLHQPAVQMEMALEHGASQASGRGVRDVVGEGPRPQPVVVSTPKDGEFHRSEEHTSELQSRENLVCRLLLEKKKKMY